ncbi:MAG: hypothetical protein JWM05_1706, partial [Acidimicrobiales bacterium]|nr:hypothetical protein [Acidimicrobiales bacterium]
MNDSATSSGVDPLAWQRLLERGRARGKVTQEEVCDVLALDTESFDA